jgi:hypothetical protein
MLRCQMRQIPDRKATLSGWPVVVPQFMEEQLSFCILSCVQRTATRAAQTKGLAAKLRFSSSRL